MTSDFKKNDANVFELLILSMNPKEESQPLGSTLFNKSKPPFSFNVTEALEKLQNLKLEIDLKKAKSNISISMSRVQAFSLLKRYFNAKLLHCPRLRTDAVIGPNSRVQITPKGTALVYSFCKNMGIPASHMPDVVKSNFNTMDLFVFERTSSEEIVYSKFLILVLFMNLMGPSPNVWTPQLAEDSITCLFENDNIESFDTDPDLELTFKSFLPQPLTRAHSESTRSSPCTKRSPFHHKYFTNPESDSHVQYYVSDAGVRLVKNKVFVVDDKKVAVDYCVSGKAICQWLCDCTTVSSGTEALAMGNLLVTECYILPITLSSKESRTFQNDRDTFYVLSEKGTNACLWGRLDSKNHSPQNDSLYSRSLSSFDLANDLKNLSLKEIIMDPGLRMLFTMHMRRDRCAENMKAYMKMTDFVKLEKVFRRLMKHLSEKQDANKRRKVYEAIDVHYKSSFSRAFHLYSAFISEDALFDINIDSKLRDQVRRLMVEQESCFEDESVNYAMTPIVDSKFLEDSEADEMSSQTTKDENRRELTDQPRSVDLLINIYLAYTQIVMSIYHLMKIDSYPKFINSDDYSHLIHMRTFYKDQ